MVKGIACTVLVGSLAAIFACSSKSSSGGFQQTSDDAATTTDDGGSSGSSGGSSGTGSSSGSAEAAAGCDITTLGLPSACESCVQQNCATQIEQCASCTITCALTCTQCESACIPGGSDAGSSKDSSASSGDGGNDSCAQLIACGGCNYVTLDPAANLTTAQCTSDAMADMTSVCTGIYAAIHAAGASFNVCQ
jgi:hypothetical protein